MTSSKMAQCFCESLFHGNPHKCVHCQEQEQREAENRVCKNWNWNYSPVECAEEALELGWSVARLVAAMKTFGFSVDNINQVVDAFERL